MADILRQFETIAPMATAIMPAKKVVIAMLTIQSAAAGDIERASTQYKLLFAGYIVLLLITAFVSWLVWRSGNRVQDAVRAEANARAEEARRDAGVANAAAGQANERANKLEGDNLTLRAQVATLETHAADAKKDVASLQKAATDARTAQQRVEIDLAKAQEATAKAVTAQEELRGQNIELGFKLEEEKQTRVELEEAIAPRNIGFEPKTNWEVREFLERFAGTEVEILVVDDFEARRLAKQLSDLLEGARWKVLTLDVIKDVDERRAPVGLIIGLNFPGQSDANPMRGQSKALNRVLTMSRVSSQITSIGWDIGRPVEIGKSPLFGAELLPPNRIRILVGLRPNWYFDVKRSREQYKELRQRDQYERANPPKPKPE